MATKQQSTKQQDVHARNVANNAVVRMQQRIQEVLAKRANKHAARIAARKHAAFIAQVHEFAAQQGIDPNAYLRSMGAAANARANSATVAPSRELVHVGGMGYTPCAAVHALCATIPNATRKEMMELCIDNGINKATAATQVGKFRAAAKAAAEEQGNNEE